MRDVAWRIFCAVLAGKIEKAAVSFPRRRESIGPFNFVIPAKAGTQCRFRKTLDSRFRGNDTAMDGGNIRTVIRRLRHQTLPNPHPPKSR